MLKPPRKVRVTPLDAEPFTGKIELALKWENPFGLKRKGVTYHVRADDDGHLYECSDDIVAKL